MAERVKGKDSSADKRGHRVEHYREITEMPTLYKIYTAALTNRLRLEEKDLITPTRQALGGAWEDKWE